MLKGIEAMRNKALLVVAGAALVVAMLALAPGAGTQPAISATEPATLGVDEVGYTGPLDKELFVYNWGDYIDTELLAEYEAKYGVRITYDNYSTNEELFTKLQAGAQYDVIFPSDYMIQRLISLNLVAKLDKANLPNFANIDPANINVWFDEGAQYCVPYMWSTTGIAYLRGIERVPEGWGALFDPEQVKYYAEKGGINVLDDQRELIGAALQYLGFSANSTDPAQLAQARDTILKVLPDIRYINSADYQETLLVPKEVVVSHSWSGSTADAALTTATEANPKGDWAHVLPKEGGLRVQDGMCIPANSTRKATAEHFINFLMRAESAARISRETGYLTANKAAQPLYEPLLLEYVPAPEQLEKLEWLRPLDEAGIALYDQIWTEIRAQ
jgi:spermidine/putrescine transport system substrate-binding protein